MALPNLLMPDWGNAGDKLADAYVQRTRQNQLAAALPGAFAGDQNALAALYKADPRIGAQVQQGNLERQRYDEAAKLKAEETRRGLMREGLVDFGSTLANADATQHASIYGTGRTQLIQQYPELAGRLPEQWSPDLLPYARALAGVKPQNPAGPTSDQLEYNQAVDQGYKGTIFDYQRDLKQAGAASTVTYGSPVAAVDSNGNPILIQPSNRGGAPSVIPNAKPAPGAGGAKDPTEDQSKAAGWLAQALNSYKNAEAVLAESPGADQPNVTADVLGAIPLVGGAARNATLTPAQQKYQQAMSSFSEAALRAATGAGVTEAEARQKIRELTPQIGDSQAVRDQKRASLLVYLDSLKTRAGRAATDVQVPNAAAANAVPDDIAAILKKHGGK